MIDTYFSRIPRPDLSVKLGVPNACTQCHADKIAQWAAAKLEQKHGKPAGQHYAEALHAGHQGLLNAEQLLSELIADDTQPAIARATAVTLIIFSDTSNFRSCIGGMID